MTIETHHDLHSEFPQDGEILHALKLENEHFRALADRYHETNREIHRVEAEIEAASDDRLEELKKERLAMLDQVSALIADRRKA